MVGMEHRTTEELEAGADEVARSPIGRGSLALIVRRPDVGEREVLDVAELDLAVGLIGDTWDRRSSRRTSDGSPHPDMQLNIMNVRAVSLIAGPPERWPLAGDQLYVDVHLGAEELPPGTRLRIGDAVVEVTDQPHRGCAKFTQRFGLPAMRFVNSDLGIRLNARGINARVVVPGTIRTGDEIATVDAPIAVSGF